MGFNTVVDGDKLRNAMSNTANAIKQKRENWDMIEWNPDTGFADAINGMNVSDSRVSALIARNYIDFPYDILQKNGHIGHYAFAGMNFNDTDVTLPDNTYYIAPYGFYQSNITSIVIPDNVYTIQYQAFGSCNYLTAIRFSNNANLYLESEICGNCQELVSVELPTNMTIIPTNMFIGCYKLTEINLPTTLTEIQSGAFNQCGLTHIEIPDSVTFIGGGAFSSCRDLVSVNLPANLVTMEWSAFSETGIESIEIPTGVTLISGNLFSNCSNLTEVKLHSNITEIQSYAFSYCNSLTRIDIPDSVTNIAWEAFEGCNNLTIYCSMGSAAEQYAMSRNIPIAYTDVFTEVTIETMPNKTTYALGGKLSLDGLSLNVTKEDGTQMSMTTGYSVGEYDFSTGGTKIITLSCGGCTVQFEVFVDENIIAYPESDHPYAPNTDQTWTYTHPTEANYLKVTFSPDTYTESNYDYIYLYDGNGSEIGVYSDCALAGQSVAISGNSFSIRLTSDGGSEHYGFSIDAIKACDVYPCDRILLSAIPEKTTYPLNGELELNGLTFEAYKLDGTSEYISEGYTVGDYDFSTEGYKDIYIYYGGCETSFQVYVDPNL